MPILKPTIWSSLENQLFNYVRNKGVELETDVANRKSGIKSKTSASYKYAGYTFLREFFDGDQWNYIPDEGGSLRVYNFVATTVFNYTAFMTNESPEFDVPSTDIKDPVEVERAERKEEILKKILDDNLFPLQFEDACQNGSMLGDSFIAGPFWDTVNKRPYFSHIKRPENIRPIFSSDDFKTIVGFIYDYYMDKNKVMEMYAEQIAKRGIVLTETPIGGPTDQNSNEQTSQNMVHIQDYWDEQYRLLIIGNKIADFVEHNWGFVPLIYVPNIPHPLKWNGISDTENILDAQVEYNEKNADVSNILKSEAYPTIFGKNLQPVHLKSGAVNLVNLGDDAELIPDPRRPLTAPVEQVIKDRKNDVVNLSGLNEIVYGGATVREATGRALSVLMQSINNRIRGRQIRWQKALQQLSANIFRLLEVYIPKSKQVIGGEYKVDIFFPGTLLRNVTDEINKYSRGLQSRYTTMKNLGVPSPKDEESLLKKERINQAEIEAAAQVIMNQAIAQAQAQQPGTPSGEPDLNEGENEPGEQPAAVAGVKQQSPVSGEGAVAQNAQRQTGVPNVK